MEKLCSKKCKKCQYRTSMSHMPLGIGCYYFGITKERRPCPPGDECTVYVKGRALRTHTPVVVNTVTVKKCVSCDGEFFGNAKKKLCPKCVKQRELNRVAYYKKIARDKKAAEEMTKDKVCVICGRIYHSGDRRVECCEDCRSLSKWTKEKRRKENGYHKEEV